jgi:hypothetical protein
VRETERERELKEGRKAKLQLQVTTTQEKQRRLVKRNSVPLLFALLNGGALLLIKTVYTL